MDFTLQNIMKNQKKSKTEKIDTYLETFKIFQNKKSKRNS